MADLWTSPSLNDWRRALERYGHVVALQGVARLAELDRWYREELPKALRARRPDNVTLPELVRMAEWKMARGVWRAPNLVLVRGNDPGLVVEISTEALAQVPHPTVATLAKKLAG